jgi:hypothetical protein
LNLLATITLEVAQFREFAPFVALLPFSKYILEVVFCVFSSAYDSALFIPVVSK